MYPDLALYIDGVFRVGEGRRTETVLEPATGSGLGDLPHATAGDLDAAVEAADRSFRAWRKVSPLDRSRVLRRAADLLRERVEGIALALAREEGKALAEARGEVMVAADIFDWSAEEGRRTYGRVVPGRDPEVRQIVLTQPVGPCAAFTPWNFPALTPARKIAAALAAGCTVVIKASEETPATAVEMVRALHDAGAPPGVVNLVFGEPATVSQHLIAAEPIRKISFTGSTAVGRRLVQLAAQGMKRTTMELGGNAPVIVCEDADLDQAVALSVAGKYRNAGQVCIAPARFFVHERLYDRFVGGFIERAAALKVGDPRAEGVVMGPLANRRRQEAMEAILLDASSHGGRVRTGGARAANEGFFFAPTVVTDLDDDARLMRDETFGPIAPIVSFSRLDDVIARANSTPLGLAAYAFTGSARAARLLSEELEAGMVGINSLAVSTPETPFGGWKESGHGQEGGVEGVQAYLNVKFVSQA